MRTSNLKQALIRAGLITPPQPLPPHVTFERRDNQATTNYNRIALRDCPGFGQDTAANNVLRLYSAFLNISE